MQKESDAKPGARAGEAMPGECPLPAELCGILTQIMLFVAKMDEEYLKYKEGEQLG